MMSSCSLPDVTSAGGGVNRAVANTLLTAQLMLCRVDRFGSQDSRRLRSPEHKAPAAQPHGLLGDSGAVRSRYAGRRAEDVDAAGPGGLGWVALDDQGLPELEGIRRIAPIPEHGRG